MYALVYYSKAARHFKQEELFTLAERASDKNSQLNITGILQYRDHHFYQYLEGGKPEIMALLQTLQQDDRHTILRTITLPTIQDRLFPIWYMRFVDYREFVNFDLIDLLGKIMATMQAPIYDEEFVREKVSNIIFQLAYLTQNKPS